jgi:hypothetical protein
VLWVYLMELGSALVLPDMGDWKILKLGHPWERGILSLLKGRKDDRCRCGLWHAVGDALW